MPGWASNAITEVRYDKEHTHIANVRGYECPPGDQFGPPFNYTRDKVIEDVESRISYCTSVKKDGKYWRGQDAIVVRINGRKYIKTENNQTEADNLGELPEF